MMRMRHGTGRRRSWVAALAAAAALSVSVTGAFGAASGPDPHFGARIAAGEATAAAVQADGKVVVAFFSGPDFLARFHPNGSLDRGFGVDGTVTTDTLVGPQAVTVDSDGRIVVAGYSPATEGSVLRRYGPTGRLDPAFGNGGTVDAGIDALEINALAIRADQRIVVAGGGCDDRGNCGSAIALLDEAGALVPSFGDQGIFTVDFRSLFGDEFRAVQPLGDNEILASADSADSATGNSSLLVRLKGTGTLDRHFGKRGVARISLPVFSFDVLGIEDIAVRHNGSIVAAGGVCRLVDGTHCAREVVLAQFEFDGSPDLSFGKRGVRVARLRPNEFASFRLGPRLGGAVSVLVRGRKTLVLAYLSGFRPYWLLRFDRNGKRDISFGKRGVAPTVVGSDARAVLLTGLRSRGLLAIGSAIRCSGGECMEGLALARYSADGRPDRTLGGRGVRAHSAPSSDE